MSAIGCWYIRWQSLLVYILLCNSPSGWSHCTDPSNLHTVIYHLLIELLTYMVWYLPFQARHDDISAIAAAPLVSGIVISYRSRLVNHFQDNEDALDHPPFVQATDQGIRVSHFASKVHYTRGIDQCHFCRYPSRCCSYSWYHSPRVFMLEYMCINQEK